MEKHCVPLKKAAIPETRLIQPTVLLIADDPDFAGAVIARWQAEPNIPNLVPMNSQAWNEQRMAICDLAIVGPVRDSVAEVIIKAGESSSRTIICLVRDSHRLESLREQHPAVLALCDREGCVDAIVLLAGEVLHRLSASQRAARAEQAMASAQGLATLGGFMLEMRHNMNNALTSVLGNSELLLMEPGAFSARVREQIATIHKMASRIHQVVQRFSLIQTEMQVAAPGSQPETAKPKLIRPAALPVVQGSPLH